MTGILISFSRSFLFLGIKRGGIFQVYYAERDSLKIGLLYLSFVYIYSGEMYGDHGIMSHLPFANYTQGVIRNRKAIFNVPISLELAADLKKMQFDITFVNPKSIICIKIIISIS